jgi:hypothetical protein
MKAFVSYWYVGNGTDGFFQFFFDIIFVYIPVRYRLSDYRYAIQYTSVQYKYIFIFRLEAYL